MTSSTLDKIHPKDLVLVRKIVQKTSDLENMMTVMGTLIPETITIGEIVEIVEIFVGAEEVVVIDQIIITDRNLEIATRIIMTNVTFVIVVILVDQIHEDVEGAGMIIVIITTDRTLEVVVKISTTNVTFVTVEISADMILEGEVVRIIKDPVMVTSLIDRDLVMGISITDRDPETAMGTDTVGNSRGTTIKTKGNNLMTQNLNPLEKEHMVAHITTMMTELMVAHIISMTTELMVVQITIMMMDLK